MATISAANQCLDGFQDDVPIAVYSGTVCFMSVLFWYNKKLRKCHGLLTNVVPLVVAPPKSYPTLRLALYGI